MRRKLLLALVVVGAAVLGMIASTSTASAIIGGEPASQPYPFMASIDVHVSGGSFFQCGGSLITPDLVETNTHCVGLREQPITADQLQVRVGSNSRVSGGTVVGVSLVIMNPTWNEDTAVGDITLLKLARAVPYRPIPISPWKPRPGDRVRDIGFGCTVVPTQCTDANLPTTLNQLDTHVVSSNQCSIGLIGPKELCSGSTKTGAQGCAGDSGSGQLVEHFGRWWLAGSVSRDGDALPADTGNCLNDTEVTVSTTDYLPWIAGVVWRVDRERITTE
jgi:hypothetical protein